MAAGEFTDAMDGDVGAKALNTTVALTFAIIAVSLAGIDFILTIVSAFASNRAQRGRLTLARVIPFLGIFAIFVYFVMAYVGEAVWITTTDSLEVPFYVFIPAAIGLGLLWARDQSMIGGEDIAEGIPPLSMQNSFVSQLNGFPRGYVFGSLVSVWLILLMFASWDVTLASAYQPEILWFGISAGVVTLGVLILWTVNLMDLFKWRKMFNRGSPKERNQPSVRHWRSRYNWFIGYQFFILLELLAIAVVWIIGPNCSQAVPSNDDIMIGYGVLFCLPFLVELIFFWAVGWQRASLQRRFGGTGMVMNRATASKPAAAAAAAAPQYDAYGTPLPQQRTANMSYDHRD